MIAITVSEDHCNNVLTSGSLLPPQAWPDNLIRYYRSILPSGNAVSFTHSKLTALGDRLLSVCGLNEEIIT
jgi:hypothetical protein